jgi:hypothetical protein
MGECAGQADACDEECARAERDDERRQQARHRQAFLQPRLHRHHRRQPGCRRHFVDDRAKRRRERGRIAGDADRQQARSPLPLPFAQATRHAATVGRTGSGT